MLTQIKIIGMAFAAAYVLATAVTVPPALAAQAVSGTAAERGTGSATSAGSGMSNAWPWPLIGEIATAYRNGSDPYAAGQHRGVDIAAPVGTPARAVASGSVSFSGKLPDGGNTVTLRTSDGEYLVSYLHLRERAVKRGAEVSVGQLLGTVGTTGKRSIELAHLHLGVRVAQTRKYVDPMGLLGDPVVASPIVASPNETPQLNQPARTESKSVRVAPLEADVETRSASPVEARSTTPLEAKETASASEGQSVAGGRRVTAASVKAPAPLAIDDVVAGEALALKAPAHPLRRVDSATRVVEPASTVGPMRVRAILLVLAALAFLALFFNRRPRFVPDSAQPPAADAASDPRSAESNPSDVVELSAARARGR